MIFCRRGEPHHRRTNAAPRDRGGSQSDDQSCATGRWLAGSLRFPQKSQERNPPKLILFDSRLDTCPKSRHYLRECKPTSGSALTLSACAH